MVRRQQVVERVERLQTQHLRIIDLAAPTLAVKKPHALKHPFDAEKIAIRVLLGTRGQELTLPAANFNLKGTRQVEVKRLRDVRNLKNVTLQI